MELLRLELVKPRILDLIARRFDDLDGNGDGTIAIDEIHS